LRNPTVQSGDRDLVAGSHLVDESPCDLSDTQHQGRLECQVVEEEHDRTAAAPIVFAADDRQRLDWDAVAGDPHFELLLADATASICRSRPSAGRAGGS
jgi:hypothetical protein